MDDVERMRSEAEAHEGMAEKPGRTWPHEDLLVRYLGALTYQPRRDAPGRDRQEAGGADVDSVEGVRGQSRRHWWRRVR
jgi:hypothetical protein